VNAIIGKGVVASSMILLRYEHVTSIQWRLYAYLCARAAALQSTQRDSG